MIFLSMWKMKCLISGETIYIQEDFGDISFLNPSERAEKGGKIIANDTVIENILTQATGLRKEGVNKKASKRLQISRFKAFLLVRLRRGFGGRGWRISGSNR